MSKKIVLITGATGVIGSAVVPLILEDPGTEVRLLMRASSEQHLQQRLDELIAFWQPELHIDPLVLSRIKPILGDVSEPRLGLTDSDYQALVVELTHIIHSAANVKMNMSVEEARQCSVVSAVEIATLAEKCQNNGQFKKLEYVSTIGVAGRMSGLVPERPLESPREFHNTYESSKSEAEAIMLAKMKDGLSATIHRPSMVVGDSATGKIVHFQVFYHLCNFLSGRYTHGVLPVLRGACLDVIPVDYVAKAIVFSNKQPQTVGKILHLCSGPDQAIKLETLREMVSKHFPKFQQASKIVSVPPWFFRWVLFIMRLFTSQKGKRALMSLSLLLGYMAESKVQFFANADTRPLLAEGGIELPSDDTYLENVFAYYLKSG